MIDEAATIAKFQTRAVELESQLEVAVAECERLRRIVTELGGDPGENGADFGARTQPTTSGGNDKTGGACEVDKKPKGLARDSVAPVAAGDDETVSVAAVDADVEQPGPPVPPKSESAGGDDASASA